MSFFKFKIESLIIKKDLGDGLKAVIAPTHIVSLASEHLGPVDFIHNRFGRVKLSDEYKDAFQFPAEVKTEENEILIIGYELKNETFLTLVVNAGDRSIMIAAFWRSDMHMELSPHYPTLNFLRRLSEAQVREIFEFVVDHPETLQFKS